jgi:hypothetical protein
MDSRELFKKLIRDAKDYKGVMSYGSQAPRHFVGKNAQFACLTDAYIDGLSQDSLEVELVKFIAFCFRQR